MPSWRRERKRDAACCDNDALFASAAPASLSPRAASHGAGASTHDAPDSPAQAPHRFVSTVCCPRRTWSASDGRAAVSLAGRALGDAAGIDAGAESRHDARPAGRTEADRASSERPAPQASTSTGVAREALEARFGGGSTGTLPRRQALGVSRLIRGPGATVAAGRTAGNLPGGRGRLQAPTPVSSRGSSLRSRRAGAGGRVPPASGGLSKRRHKEEALGEATTNVTTQRVGRGDPAAPPAASGEQRGRKSPRFRRVDVRAARAGAKAVTELDARIASEADAKSERAALSCCAGQTAKAKSPRALETRPPLCDFGWHAGERKRRKTRDASQTRGSEVAFVAPAAPGGSPDATSAECRSKRLPGGGAVLLVCASSCARREAPDFGGPSAQSSPMGTASKERDLEAPTTSEVGATREPSVISDTWSLASDSSCSKRLPSQRPAGEADSADQAPPAPVAGSSSSSALWERHPLAGPWLLHLRHRDSGAHAAAAAPRLDLAAGGSGSCRPDIGSSSVPSVCSGNGRSEPSRGLPVAEACARSRRLSGAENSTARASTLLGGAGVAQGTALITLAVDPSVAHRSVGKGRACEASARRQASCEAPRGGSTALSGRRGSYSSLTAARKLCSPSQAAPQTTAQR
ncbi:kinesin motor domain-containing protein [Besnoitia besnoiti]|nr:kinesin motor domain-containing protein [Besnoitia besnoiti]PFH38109.1 kinesin motor domain-containing protein [Besnoitia besnoiti]